MDDLRNRPAREIFEDHLRIAREWSFEEDIERNFSKECVVLSQHGIHRGHEGLKELAQLLREEMPGAAFEYTTQLVEGEAAFLEWTARSESVRVADGANSFFIRDGLVGGPDHPLHRRAVGVGVLAPCKRGAMVMPADVAAPAGYALRGFRSENGREEE